MGEAGEAVTIAGPSGSLLGILHRPESVAEPSACIIMLSAGQVSRVGPQRLYVRAAREWVKRGAAVLRVDLAGIGDAVAENDTIHFDNHSAADVAAAVAFARARLPASRIVLLGLCAGARVAFKYAAKDDGVDAVLSWSCPIHSSTEGMPSSPEESGAHVMASRARDSRRRIAGAILRLKFLTPSWWQKRFTGGWAELRLLARAFGTGSQARRGEIKFGSFLESFDGYVQAQRRALFVYGDKDRIALAEFRERCTEVTEAAELPQALTVVPGGTHTFSSCEAQRQAIEASTAWLDRGGYLLPVH